MAKKKITRKDPHKEIAGWLDYRSKDTGTNDRKVSASLKKLQAERRHALLTRLGVIILVSTCLIVILGYFVSPKSNVGSIQIKGVPELNSTNVVKATGIEPKDKVLSLFFKQNQYSNKLSKKFPEIESVSVEVKDLNHVILNVKERKIIGYIQESNDSYRKILSNGKVGSITLPKNQIDTTKPLFIRYNKKASLKEDLEIYSELPDKIKSQIRMMSGETKRPTQIIFVMKDNNVVIGNTSNITDKFKYYTKIKAQLKEPSIVDLEIGAFSRPLTNEEKIRLGITP